MNHESSEFDEPIEFDLIEDFLYTPPPIPMNKFKVTANGIMWMRAKGKGKGNEKNNIICKEMCGICLESLPLIALQCTHSFCESCLSRLMRPSCPFCRATIHAIYY